MNLRHLTAADVSRHFASISMAGLVGFVIPSPGFRLTFGLEADRAAIAEDWYAVGDDLRTAFEKAAAEKSVIEEEQLALFD